MTDQEAEIYCKICDSCGEDGCCSAIICQQHQLGKYCETYLKDLQLAYLMYNDLELLLKDDVKYQSKIQKLYDKNYEKIYRYLGAIKDK